MFKGHAISDIIELIEFRPTDRIIEVDIDFKTHTTKRDDGTYPYPDNDLLLNKFGETEALIIAGFHIWDCAEKLARRAYERKSNVLADEDLTELFGFSKELFLETGKDKPWPWQEY